MKRTEKNVDMTMQTLRRTSLLVVAVVVAGVAGRAWGLDFGLGETKDELKLKCDIAVEEHSFEGASTERVTEPHDKSMHVEYTIDGKTGTRALKRGESFDVPLINDPVAGRYKAIPTIVADADHFNIEPTVTRSIDGVAVEEEFKTPLFAVRLLSVTARTLSSATNRERLRIPGKVMSVLGTTSRAGFLPVR